MKNNKPTYKELEKRILELESEIAESKKTEEEQCFTNDLLSKFISHSPIFCYIKDVNPQRSLVLHASDNFVDMIGIPGYDMIGKTMTELFPPEFAAKITADDWDVVSKGEVLRVDEELNGRSYITIKYPITLGKKTLLAGYTIDISERKRAETELFKTQAILQAALDQSTAGIAIADAPDGKLLYVNDAGLQILGDTREKIVNDIGINQYASKWNLFGFDGEPLKNEEIPLYRSIKFGETSHRELIIRRSNNDERIVSANSAPIISNEGEITAAVVVFPDITESRRTEEVLRESEEKFRLLYTSMEQGLALHEIITDENGNPADYVFLEINDSYTRIVGVTREIAIGKRVKEIFPEVEQYWIDTFGKVALTGESCYYENYLEIQNKYYSTYSYSPKKNQFAVLVTDITERKLAEEKLQESEKKFRGYIENAPDGVFIITPSGFYKDVNASACNLLGYTKEEFFSMHVSKIVAEENLDKAKTSINTLINEGKYADEITFVRKDGSTFIGLLSATKLSEGEFLGFVKDISVRKRLESALEKRILALTSPLDKTDSIAFQDLFEPAVIQRIQDEFSTATGVASIITLPDGTPITAPSNFTYLCNEIIRKNEKGCANCFKSDAALGRLHAEGPIVQTCLSGGLWDAGASITVGDRHVANWLIGQVRDETQSEEKMMEYAREIGADEGDVIEAFRMVPAMSNTQFRKVSQALFTMANQLSTTAYQNVQQARFISERRQAENALRESEKKLSTLFESMAEMVCMYELVFNDQGKPINCRMTDCNNSYTKITGIKKENAIGKLADEVYAEDMLEMEALIRVALTGEPFEYTKYFEPLDKHFMISVVSPKKNHFATITTDFTAIKKTQEIISAKNKELENYLYVASHDLRSPLVNIQGFSQRLQKQAEIIKNASCNLSYDTEIKNSIKKITEEDIPKTLDFIFTNVSKMDKLISGLLQISRTGRLKMNIKKVNMKHLIETIVHSYNFQIEERSAEIIVDDLGECYGDENLLNQLFSNLLANALKYADKNRKLIITITSKEQYNKVIYIIKDNGIGIATRHLERIWDVFFQVNPNLNLSGEGLGLSIVKRIVEKHKGKIWIESEEGKGTIFYLELNKNEFSE